MTKKLEHVSFTVPEVDDIRAEQVCAEQMGMQLFELYLTLHEFCDLKEHLPVRWVEGVENVTSPSLGALRSKKLKKNPR